MNTGFPTRFGTVRQRGRPRARRGPTWPRSGSTGSTRAALVGTLTPADEDRGGGRPGAARRTRGTAVKLLVLDEPTATLPDNEVQHLLDIVRQVAASGVGVLYVTHRLDEVFQVADRVTVLRDGHKVATEPTTALDRKRLINLLVGSELDEIARRGREPRRTGRRQEPVLRGRRTSPRRRCATCRSRSRPATSSASPASPARAARPCSARSSARTSATAAPSRINGTVVDGAPPGPVDGARAWPTCRRTARSSAGSWSSRPARTSRCPTSRRSGAGSCCAAGPSAARRAPGSSGSRCARATRSSSG